MTNVSVVIVNYNSGRFLEICVSSIYRSDCSLEIIVVDNASTDGSADFLSDLTANDMSLRVIKNTENCGFAAAVNRGVGNSSSDNILLLNPDCLVLPHTIRSLSEVLDIDTPAGIAGGLVFNFDGSEQRGCRRREPTLARSLGKVFQKYRPSAELKQVDMTGDPLPEKRIYVDAVSGSFLMIRRSAFSDVGGMDERFFLHFEDLDLCRRVRDFGWKVLFVPDISIFHYQGGSSEHSEPRISREKHRSMRRYQRKHHGRKPWFGAFVFLIVWGHFLLQRTNWMVTRGSIIRKGRQVSPAEWRELSCLTASIDNEKGNRLLVLGHIDESVQDIIVFGVTIGWSIYACNEVQDTFRIGDVHWFHQEYFAKVPARDAPSFNALLVSPSLSHYEALDRIVDKFGVKRIAIIQLVSSSDGPDVDDVATSLALTLDKETVAGHLMRDQKWSRKTRSFSLPSPKFGKVSHAIRLQCEQTIQDCFSWLSK